MKILFCIGGLTKGGAERVITNLSNYLVEKGNDVAIVVTKADKIAYEISQKVKIYELEEKQNIQLMRQIRLIINLRKKFSDFNPDINISFLEVPTLRMLLLKIFSIHSKKIPLIVSLRIDPNIAFSGIKGKILLKLYKYANGFVFQTNDAQAFFNKDIKERSVVIANPVDNRFFKEYYSGLKEEKIVSVGRLTKQKNYPLLIEGFYEFQKKHNNYKLFIYGVGEEKDNLIQLVDKLNLKNKVIFKGNVDNIIDEIYNAKMFVMTSDYEGLSNALMEAMTLGVPCISTNSSGGGAKMLIKNEKNGILINVNDKKALIKKLNYLADNEDFNKKISYNSWVSMKKYDSKIINNKWLEYIESFVERK